MMLRVFCWALLTLVFAFGLGTRTGYAFFPKNLEKEVVTMSIDEHRNWEKWKDRWHPRPVLYYGLTGVILGGAALNFVYHLIVRDWEQQLDNAKCKRKKACKSKQTKGTENE